MNVWVDDVDCIGKVKGIWAFQLCSHIAYLRVHSLAVASYLTLSFLNIWAISGTKGSSGLGSVNKELIDKRTLEIVRAGDH